MNPRRIQFIVGTSLVTASLAGPSLGCKPKQTVNTRPPDDVHVNEGPQVEPDVAPVETEGAAPDVEPEIEAPAEPADPVYVNEGPQPLL